MKKTIKVTPYWQDDRHDLNYDRTYAGNNFEHCEICGRRLNPKTTKLVQLLECGFWTDEQGDVKDVLDDGGRGQGFFPVGPTCYKEIRRRIADSKETRQVEI